MLSYYWIRIKGSIFPERTPCFVAAKTQDLTAEELKNAPYSFALDSEEYDHIQNEETSKPEDNSSFREPNVFDHITTLAGSTFIFILMLVLVGLWAILGLIYGLTDTWQIIFQNSSSIQVYIVDILLIRQQQNANRALLTTLAEFNSRRQKFEYLLSRIPGCDKASTQKEGPRPLFINGQLFDDNCDESLHLPVVTPSLLKSVWNKTCLNIAQVLGSIWAILIYCISIGLWIGLGPSLKFSNTWQLYVNTGTALVLTFTSVFLQNIQQREEDKLTLCLNYTLEIDAKIERQLRVLTGDQKPNLIYTIPTPKRTFTERFADFIADIMGSGLGVALSLLFVVFWLAFGPQMQFKDNWWLIIGTFTGLVGYIDGFVLRSLYLREEIFVKDQFMNLSESDSLLFEQINVPYTTPSEPTRSTIDIISLWISDTCGHRYGPIFAVFTVFLLLVLASAMSWSMTGQLLCNTPSMIIEGFLLLILINAHNYANQQRSRDFTGLFKRRLLLHAFVQTIS